MSLDKRNPNIYALMPQSRSETVWIVSALTGSRARNELMEHDSFKDSIVGDIGRLTLSKISNSPNSTEPTPTVIGQAPYRYFSNHFE